jgi:hypothetical protein
VVFWGLIFVSWLTYPKEHHYSILTHTFSFLGSFESKHNPGAWWIFSIAMLFWGSAAIPLVLYFRRRLAVISRWGAWAGAFSMLAGCVGIMTVAMFPDAHGKVIGDFEWTHIHEKAALLVAVGFTLGILWHGALLVTDRMFRGRSAAASRFAHRKFMWPYLVWTSVVSVGLYFQIKSRPSGYKSNNSNWLRSAHSWIAS